MIKIENVRKAFDGIAVLNNVSLEINKGKYVAIVGKSWSGKSTLLNIIGTLEKADGGQIFQEKLKVFKIEKQLNIINS